MKRSLFLILILAACATVPAPVAITHIDVPTGAYDVQGANPRQWSQVLSFGPWQTVPVAGNGASSWLADLGVLQLGPGDEAYRMALKGTTGTTNIECHTRGLVAGPAGVFLQASLGQSPVLVCGFERLGLRSVLALTRTSEPEPSLRGELRQVGGTTYDVKSLHRASQSSTVSAEPLGFEIGRDEQALAIVETGNGGRVWIDTQAPNREDLAAASAALLLFRDGA